MHSITDKTYAQELDAQDILARFRERFVFPDPNLIYTDGNSLGRLPKATAKLADNLINKQWGDGLIRSWNEGWMYAPERIGGKIAQLLGAHPDEIIMADATSVILFKLVVAGLQFQSGRKTILTDDMNFPSDIYILEGIIDLLKQGHELQILLSEDEIHGPVSAIKDKLDTNTALLTLSLTAFKSSYTYDMADLTRAAHEVGALVLWDVSHSAGALPIDLNGANVDLAVGCTYKYLNGGPGAPAFLYIRRDLQDKLVNPISGWMGKKNMFDFALSYEPDPTLRHFLTSSPPIISLSLVEPGVDLLLEAGMDRLRAKSIQQTEYLIALWEAILKDLGFTLNSPPDPDQRGSHISLGHEEGLRIDQALIHEMNVIPDFRPPDSIRIGVTPLYTSYSDIYEVVMRLKKIVSEGLYKKYSHEPPDVT